LAENQTSPPREKKERGSGHDTRTEFALVEKKRENVRNSFVRLIRGGKALSRDWGRYTVSGEEDGDHL